MNSINGCDAAPETAFLNISLPRFV